MRSVPFGFVASLAAEYSAVECHWRESDRSFTGFVAEVWFDQLPSQFAMAWAVVVGYQARVRCLSGGPGRFAVSVPVVVPQGQVQLRGGQWGGVLGCGWSVRASALLEGAIAESVCEVSNGFVSTVGRK